MVFELLVVDFFGRQKKIKWKSVKEKVIAKNKLIWFLEEIEETVDLPIWNSKDIQEESYISQEKNPIPTFFCFKE